jgi:TolA-binding protein
VKPLRDDVASTDPNVLAAQALLSKVLPLEPNVDRQRRVRLRLDTAGRHSSLPPLLRPALVAGVLLAVTAAGAKMGGVLPGSPASAVEKLFSKPVAAIDAPIAQAKARTHALKGKARQAEPSTESADVPLIDIDDLPRSRTHAAPPPSGTPGAKLMVEAMKARRSGDTARASRLLKEYQRKYPEGALQEEALALSMEAAAARGDASATKLARQYLERYPNGRFRDQAQRVLRPAQR